MDLHSNRDRLLKSDTVTDLTGAYRLLSEGKSAALQAPKQSDFFDGKSSDDLHAFFTKWHDQFAGYVTLQDAMGKTAEEIAERCLMPGEDVRLVLNPRPPEIALFTDKSEGMRGALRAHNESVTADIAFHNSERFGRAARYAEDCGRGDLVPGLNAIAEHYRRQYSAASNWPLFYVWENCGKSYGTAAMMVACRAYRAAVGLEEWPHEGPVDLLGCVLQTNIELVESEEWKAQEMITGRTGE